jgi:hypothetical protein
MKVQVIVKDKMIALHCGEGFQTVQWLANAALARYDASYGTQLGAPLGVVLKSGKALDMSATICDSLVDGAQVFVQLRDESTMQPVQIDAPAQ